MKHKVIILKASRSSCNETVGKDMYGCLELDGIVECYFPTAASFKRNAKRFAAVVAKPFKCNHKWLHPGTSKTRTHCVLCGLAYEERL